MVEKENFIPKSARIKAARLEAIFAGIKSGEDNTSIELKKIRAEKSVTDKRGQESEKRFFELVSKIPLVLRAQRAGIRDDINGIDAYILLDQNEKLPWTPVNVKSSTKGIERFRKSPNYQKLNGKIFCLNCNWYIKKSDLLSQIISEARRIRAIDTAK